MARKQGSKEKVAPCDIPWDVRFLMLPDKTVPALDFLRGCERAVRSELGGTLSAVADDPLSGFVGGLRWTAMRGAMKGIFEARDKHGDRLYRIFCVLDRRNNGLSNCSIVVLTGMVKDDETSFSNEDYAIVRKLADDYLASDPRPVA